ncbi:MAG: TldD/PmbA family protein [Bacilli bacterium]|nr:TldD/PmbA family protein [Bacilli bacterium]
MNKETYEKIINYTINKGVDFVELYYEEQKINNYLMIDSKLDDIVNGNTKGLGIRIYNNDTVYYTATNDLDYDSIIKQIDIILSNIKDLEEQEKNITLEKEEVLLPKIKIEHDDYKTEGKTSYLKKIDKEVRSYSDLINQVRIGFYEADKKYTVTNSNGVYKTSREVVTRIFAAPYAKKGEISENTFEAFGEGRGYEFLDNFDYKKFSKNVAKVVVDKLSAKKFEGGTVPVIIGNGFGAVIFHEACGHSLEATSVADNLSVMSNKLGEKVASNKVTLIDDGTIKEAWGSSIVDSEGNKTEKNILIENGILKSYLVDDFNSKKMNHKITGSGRRQNYHYAPTSRMNNTYLDKGTDKIEDMIKSIDYGVYCKSMSGGSVDPKTDDFNFSVEESYLIENGKITDMLKGLTLIGKGQDILKQVEMVSDDLELASSYCGSMSGTVNVTVGQPTIKVSKILVGGSK